jgi:dTDP-4-dehydrorhamnose reductase
MRLPEAPNISSTCITDRAALQQLRTEFSPTHVIHGAGVCDLDVCEERPQWAESLNVDGCRAIAEVFGASAYIMHLSTDLVFSGDSPPHHGYAEDAVPDPISVAGRTFADGEREIARCPRHCIVRLGLPFGASVTGDKGARDWVAGRLRKGRPVTLFVDEWRSLIECDELADTVVRLVVTEVTGLLHCGGNVPVSLHEVGERVVAWGGFAPELLNGIHRHEEKNGPPRIGNVALDSRKLQGVLAVSDWPPVSWPKIRNTHPQICAD